MRALVSAPLELEVRLVDRLQRVEVGEHVAVGRHGDAGAGPASRRAAAKASLPSTMRLGRADEDGTPSASRARGTGPRRSSCRCRPARDRAAARPGARPRPSAAAGTRWRRRPAGAVVADERGRRSSCRRRSPAPRGTAGGSGARRVGREVETARATAVASRSKPHVLDQRRPHEISSVPPSTTPPQRRAAPSAEPAARDGRRRRRRPAAPGRRPGRRRSGPSTTRGRPGRRARVTAISSA